MVRGLTRAGVVLVFGVVGVLVWRAVLLAGLPDTITGKNVTAAQAARHLPAGMSVLLNRPALQVVDDRLGTTLGTLTLALLIGVVVGFGVAALRAVAGPPDSGGGRLVGAVGWLVGALWTPPVPLALTSLVVVVVKPRSLDASATLLVMMLGGVVALLVAAAVAERWRRRAWLVGVAAGLSALGRSLAVLAGALVVGENLVSRPGVGTLLIQSMIQLDPYVVADAATVFLVVALIGQVVAALAGVWLDHLEPVAPPVAPPGLGIAALASLVLPVLFLVGSLAAGSTTRYDLRHVMAGPSSAHPLGTDELGRDVLSRLLVGYQHAVLSAVGAVLLAGVVGVAWGALAAFLARRVPGAGGPLAELVLAPARLVAVAPLLLAGLILAGADTWPATLALAVVLVARVAAAVAELDRPVPGRLVDLGRAAGGVALLAVGAGLSVLVGLGFLGFAGRPPVPTLGGVLQSGALYFQAKNDSLMFTALVILVVTVPWLLAGAALARNPRRAEAFGTLVS